MRRRKFPAPPPTPEGMVWRKNGCGETVLVTAEEAQLHSARIMADFDSQPKWLRKQQWGNEIVGDHDTA